MKAFTFLGTGKLYPSAYTFEGKKSSETQFFAEAIIEFFEPESLYIFATESAAREPVSDDNQTERLKFLNELLGKRTTVFPVSIPEGADEKELWEIFNVVVDKIQDNDKVLFDITHGFRSLPFLTFLALAYVRKVKNDVKIERVIYGAYEAVERGNPKKPVFDLTPFVSLLDWLGVVTMFLQTGDARPIADLDVPRDIANALTGLSNSLLTNRTLEAQTAAFKFNGLDFTSLAPPFRMLVDQLKQSYQQMAVYDPSKSPTQSLKAQYLQIKWYVENQHYLQAITLMREWLISWKCPRNKWLNMGERGNAEKALSESSKKISGPFFEILPLAEQTAITLWDKCGGIRNDLAHCGMRHRPQASAEAIEAIKVLFNKFEEFAQNEVR